MNENYSLVRASETKFARKTINVHCQSRKNAALLLHACLRFTDSFAFAYRLSNYQFLLFALEKSRICGKSIIVFMAKKFNQNVWISAMAYEVLLKTCILK